MQFMALIGIGVRISFSAVTVRHYYYYFYSFNPATWGNSLKDVEHVKIHVT